MLRICNRTVEKIRQSSGEGLTIYNKWQTIRAIRISAKIFLTCPVNGLIWRNTNEKTSS